MDMLLYWYIHNPFGLFSALAKRRIIEVAMPFLPLFNITANLKSLRDNYT